MSDYKELIRTLRMRGLSNGSVLGYHSALFDDAADVIEQLVKERDDEQEAADDFQHLFFDKARECEQLRRERDAAVADLEEYHDCDVCKNNNEECLNNGLCKKCSVGKITRKHWEWRGVQDGRPDR